MTDTSMLPQPGETLILPDGEHVAVAWVDGWTWPVGDAEPTRIYARGARRGLPVGESLRVIAGRDVTGTRFWMAERRET